MRPPLASLSAVAAALALAAPPARAQDDLRDQVTLKSGAVVRGRVLEAFAPDEVVVVQGQKRVRLPRRNVAGMTTVNDRLRELLARRRTQPDNVRWQWFAVEHARQSDLPRMAVLQAWSVLAVDPNHEAAREMLGHRRGPKAWMVHRGGQWHREQDHDAYQADWGHPLILESEHFRLRTNAGWRRAVAALWDLEAMYVWWFDSFGEALRPREVLLPMEMSAWASEDAFPGWTEMRIPYFIPAPYDDECFTFFAADAERPKDLFGLGLQHLLYRSLAYDTDCGSYKNRRCAWLELGLSQWVDTVFQGPPGRAVAVLPAPPLPRERARLVLEKKRYELKHLLHRHVRDSFYAAVAETTPIDWAYAQAFATFLIEGSETRPKLLEYLRQVLRESKGDSSSTFDRVMGRIEDYEPPFTEWLEQARARTSG